MTFLNSPNSRPADRRQLRRFGVCHWILFEQLCTFLDVRETAEDHLYVALKVAPPTNGSSPDSAPMERKLIQLTGGVMCPRDKYAILIGRTVPLILDYLSRGCAAGYPGVFADARKALPFLASMLFQNNREGWFKDTAVPLVDHSKHENQMLKLTIVPRNGLHKSLTANQNRFSADKCLIICLDVISFVMASLKLC